MMQDRASGTLQKLTGSSVETINKLTKLHDKTESLKRSTSDFGSSIGNLKQKIDILQGERDLIDPENLTKIRQYNREIQTLTTRIGQLENTTGGKFKTYAKDAFAQIPGAGLMTNPLVLAGVGVAAAGKLAVSWEEGMAKINATAQLPQNELDKLGKTIKKLGVEAGANLQRVPDAYEKILSQTGDVALSTDILDKALKGAKAGFTDVDVVSGALAQSLSAIGKENTNAQEVLDTLFAAKRVGAGEFADFARYVPGLVSAGQNIGTSWKETAGMFAYMTGKGQEAGSAAMYIQNAFTALGKSEITEGLKKAGVNVFDNKGNIRSMVDVFTDLSKLTKSMNDQQKSDFFEKIGLRDMQAKAAFSILTGETDKLREAMNATANASGELQTALDSTGNTGNKLRETWAKIQSIGQTLGGVIVTFLNPVLDVLGGLLSGVAWALEGVGTVWSWWTGLIQQGNTWIVGLTVLLGGLTAALIIHNLWLKKDIIWTGLVTAAKVTWATVTGVVTGAMWGLNMAMLANPIILIVTGIMALVAAFIAAWRHSEKFRGAIMGIWEVIKGFGTMLKNYVVDRITGILKGLGGIASAIGKLFRGDFKGAIDEGKEALMNITPANAIKNAVESGKNLGDKFRSGYEKGVENFKNNKIEAGYVKDEKTGKWVKKNESKPLIDKVNPGSINSSFNMDELLSKFNKSKKSTKDDSLSLGIPQNYSPTNTYAAITNKLGMKAPDAKNEQSTTETPVKSIAARVEDISVSLRKIAASVAIPVALTVGAANASPVIPAGQEQNGLFRNIASTVSNYDNSTTITDNKGKDAKYNTATVNNTTNNQGRTIHIERFTDKIEIHVSGQNAPQLAAEQVREEVEKALAEIFNV